MRPNDKDIRPKKGAMHWKKTDDVSWALILRRQHCDCSKGKPNDTGQYMVSGFLQSYPFLSHLIGIRTGKSSIIHIEKKLFFFALQLKIFF